MLRSAPGNVKVARCWREPWSMRYNRVASVRRAVDLVYLAATLAQAAALTFGAIPDQAIALFHPSNLRVYGAAKRRLNHDHPDCAEVKDELLYGPDLVRDVHNRGL